MRRICTFIFIWALLTLWGVSGAAAEELRPRIISLYAAHTELLLRLGARDHIIGVSAQETYRGPETEGWEPEIFSIRDDVEKILAARPDIIIMRPMHLALGSHVVEMLRGAGVRLLDLQVRRADELYEYWRTLAALVGRESQAEEMIEDFDRRVQAWRRAAAARPEAEKPGVFLEAIFDSIKTFTPDSLPVWLVELAGGRNVAADAAVSASPAAIVVDYGPERLLAKADEVDIYVSQAGPMNSSSLQQLKRRGIYQPLKAFKEGRVYKIPEEILSRPTPSLLQGLEMLASWTALPAPPAEGPELSEGAPGSAF